MRKHAGMWCVLGLLAAIGCRQQERVQLGEAQAISRSTSVGAAPMFAAGPEGREAVAWVSAPDGGTEGSVYIALNDAEPVELRDELGPIEAHGEAPPKIVFGADGALNALYVVSKVVPGRRFPVGALRFTRSEDGGTTWLPPVTVTDDTTVFGSHNFHALHAAANGTLYASWLDGRLGKSAAFVSRSSDGGRTWETNQRVSTDEACPCCRTALASGGDGAMFLAWRTVLPGNIRDIVVASSTDGGATWSPEVRVHADNWVFEACPHAGPSMQVDAAGTVHIAWWTGKQGSAGVYYARSEDRGGSWSPPVAIATAAVSRPAHVQLSLGDNGMVAVAWDDGTVATPQVLLRVSRDGGRSFAPTQEVSSRGRAAGFPVLAVAGDRITLAWSEQSPEAAESAARRAPDMRDPQAVKGLTPVGSADVMVRRGTMR